MFFNPLALAKTSIGILSYPDDKAEQKDPKIIPIFFKEKSNWSVLTTDKSIKKWSVILDGKKIGDLDSAKINLFKAKPVAIDFESFLGSVSKKAFALVANGNAEDPNKWKPLRLQGAELKQKQDAFLKLIGRTSSKETNHFRCPGFWKLDDQQKKKEELCGDMYAKIQLNWAYSDKHGTLIAQFVIETDKAGEFEGTTETIKKWVVYNAADSTRYLFKDHKDVWDAYLIEAADFDGTGESKLLFEKSGYNWFEYELFDSKLLSLQTMGSSFH